MEPAAELQQRRLYHVYPRASPRTRTDRSQSADDSNCSTLFNKPLPMAEIYQLLVGRAKADGERSEMLKGTQRPTYLSEHGEGPLIFVESKQVVCPLADQNNQRNLPM